MLKASGSGMRWAKRLIVVAGLCGGSLACAGTNLPQLPERPASLDHASWEALLDAAGKSIAQQTRLTRDASFVQGHSGDQFGISVDLDGDTAVVGAFVPVGFNNGQGAVFVFVRSGTTWMQQAQLLADDGSSGAQFGGAVALDGDTVLVGAPGTRVNGRLTQGAAYMFVRNDGAWSQQARLTASDGEARDQFGRAVALDGDVALIGSPGAAGAAGADQGAAYVFTRSAGTWTEQARLQALSGGQTDAFGLSVALEGDTALIGAFKADVDDKPGQGAAYVFVGAGGTWAEQVRLTADDGEASDNFGVSVALHQDTALVGAYRDDLPSGPQNRGSAYVFVRNAGAWSQQAKLTADDALSINSFGASVALEGDRALVGGAWVAEGSRYVSGSGHAHLFVREGNQWAQQARLDGGPTASDDNFGVAVAMHGGQILVGANFDRVGDTPQGSVMVFGAEGEAWVPQTQLTAGDGRANDWLGYSVALDGDTALVGVPLDDIGGELLGDVVDQGSAYVFVRSGMTWVEQAKLIAQDGGPDDLFGYQVALDGDTAVISAYRDDIEGRTNQGSAYVFTRSGSAWTQQAKLFAQNGAAEEGFGQSVAISGDTVVVGSHRSAFGGNPFQGAAHVYVRNGTEWAEQDVLFDEAGDLGDGFGSSVDVQGEAAIIGAPGTDAPGGFQQGVAHVYVRSGTEWAHQARLSADDAASSDRFGTAVAMDGDTVLVGACAADVGVNTDQGAAYIFKRGAGGWSQQAKLTASEGQSEDFFGCSVGLTSGIALVGAATSDGSETDVGAAYVFAEADGEWLQLSRLEAADATSGGRFGAAVAMDSGVALVGAPFAPGLPPLGVAGEGAAYAFTDFDIEASALTLLVEPNPSVVSGVTRASVSVSGVVRAPEDGQVLVTASTGEQCEATAPTRNGSDTAVFSCDLIFETSGTRTLFATFSGSTTHAEGRSADQQHAAKFGQSIEFGSNPGPLLEQGPSASVTATASSGLPVSFASATRAVCAVDPQTGLITILRGGNCVVTADQEGDADFAPAPRAMQTVRIDPVGEGVDISVLIRREAPVGKLLESVMTKGGSLARYSIEVKNHSAQDISGISLEVPWVLGLNNVLWTCTPGCNPSSGAGLVRVLAELPAGAVLSIDLTGEVDASERFVEIVAQARIESGVTVLLREDDRYVFIEPSGAEGLFRNGLE